MPTVLLLSLPLVSLPDQTRPAAGKLTLPPCFVGPASMGRLVIVAVVWKTLG